MENYLKCKKFSFAYGSKNFKSFTLKVPEMILKGGDIHLVFGKNGSGKTTFFKIVSAAINNKDYFLINNISSSNKKLYRRLIGYVPDKELYPDNLKCKDLLKLFVSLLGISKREMELQWEYFSRFFPILNDLLNNNKLSQLSMGQSKLFSIATRLLANPNLIILDEPFNGLDSDNIIKLTKIIEDYKIKGKIILISANTLEIKKRFNTNTILIEDGIVKC